MDVEQQRGGGGEHQTQASGVSVSERLLTRKTGLAMCGFVVLGVCGLAALSGSFEKPVAVGGGVVPPGEDAVESSVAGPGKKAEEAVLPELDGKKSKSTPSGISQGISKDFDVDGRFIYTDYDSRKPFASFLPGIGGEWGMPMWAFYVNRGQGMAAFGVSNKDGPLLEFTPANKAYQIASTSGFRTMLRITKKDGDVSTSQPFFEPAAEDCERTMLIGMNELEITETDSTTELQTRVLYYTVPGEDFPALVRRVTISNQGDDELDLEIVDGLARMEPFGVNSGMLSAMGRTLEGWMRVYNCLDEVEGSEACTKPFYKLSASTADSAVVQMIEEGNFVLAYTEDDHELIPIIVDPDAVFGQDTTLRRPFGFFDKSPTLEDLLTKRNELKASKTPSAFAAVRKTLPPGHAVTLVEVYGHVTSLQQLNDDVIGTVTAPNFVSSTYKSAVDLVNRLTSAVESSTSNALFDAFSRQMLLDNLLRGGYPEFLGGVQSPKVYHTFSRIHGDLERDYNNFQIDPSYFSQGSGNYRDVNQNRRVDVLLFPKLKDFNLRQFLTLKQADGYNPLTVTTAFFHLNGGAKELATSVTKDAGSAEALASLLERPFRPGQLFTQAFEKGVNFTLPPARFLDAVAAASTQVYSANYTHEGFWADHWTYDLDQVESFEAIYPDDLERAMWDAPKLAFYMSSGTVQPRDFKYVEVQIQGETCIRQYNSVYDDPDKLGQLGDRVTKWDGSFQLAVMPNDNDATDEDWTYVYTVAPITKLVLLCVTKFALLDPSGMGIEMDANKPGWNDAMNGLPGLLGSGMPETCETLRLARWLEATLAKFPRRDIEVPVELADFIKSIDHALDSLTDDFKYWDAVADAREEYRSSVRLFFSGDEVKLRNYELQSILRKFQKKLEKGIEKSLKYSPDGVIMPTYFAHKVIDYEYTGYESYLHQKFVHAKKFDVQVFPLFLEGPVRQLKTIKRDDGNAMVAIYDAVLKSGIYDAPLQQYKICESLQGQPFEMGRMMAFTPGWLENESIWLHMSFKYYLELLRGGLYDQFWHAMSTGAPYNMPVETYGRSPLECGSFIVSSAYPDKHLWGTSFLARLSGSTAEFLSMWLIIFAGQQPFQISEANTLELWLKPAIPVALFKSDATASFKFLGAIDVTYHNPNLLDTWIMVARRHVLTKASGETVELTGPKVLEPYATEVRNLEYASIDVYY